MPGSAIFAPVVLLAAWTATVLLGVGVARFSAARAGKVTTGDFRYEEPASVPARARLLNRNYMNLLELTVLFYVVCIIAFVTGVATPLIVGLAWLDVGLRIVHTLVHVLYNDVMHRFAAFAASNGVLAVIWVSVGIAIQDVAAQ
jgi:hypothetical protein